jgi:hypothetical protein
MLKYKNYSDDELMEIFKTNKEFSGKSTPEIDEEINNRGGIDMMQKQQQERRVVPNEIRRITNEIFSLNAEGINPDFLKTVIKSDILPEEQLHKVIEEKYKLAEAYRNNKKIKSRTIAGSLAGIAVSAVVVGILWMLQMAYYKETVHYIGIVVAYFICYGIIRLITRQTASNAVVLIAAVLATVISILAGIKMYQLYFAT